MMSMNSSNHHDHSTERYIMSSSRSKKTTIPSSKKRRGLGSSSEELFQILRIRPITTGRYIDWAALDQVQLADAIHALLSTDLWERFFAITKPTYLELTLELCSTFHLQVVMMNNDDPGTIHFRLGGLVRAMSVPEFGVALGLYTDDFMEEEDMNTLPRNIHISPSLCWKALAPLSSTYDPSRSKASALPPSLRYLHAILVYTLNGRRESTGFVNTHDAYYIWCMANVHEGSDLHRPYVTRLARHFGLLNTVAQSSALTLIGQMSLQGITTMLHMRMIECQRGTGPPQYRLSHAIDEEDLVDIPDDVPPQYEEPSTAPPRERPVHAATSLSHLSDRLAHFEQYCTTSSR
ncbi:hypothetical protein PVK06_049189 [Gossypium arboreum]|uniref:Arabidopsis retrotransposon Orf1 C-terminal domain-containing protein n=1 Tax=Gossypium arboreum TaxID=29729 RepID=A0ABR0MHY5_GOSAR|nr:hypothetical protein PVK06_049189 [Gossypium arboreum]